MTHLRQKCLFFLFPFKNFSSTSLSSFRCTKWAPHLFFRNPKKFLVYNSQTLKSFHLSSSISFPNPGKILVYVFVKLSHIVSSSMKKKKMSSLKSDKRKRFKMVVKKQSQQKRKVDLLSKNPCYQ